MVQGYGIGEDAMMNVRIDQRLEFITPAFLAGADQNKPEMRSPSIRGALRWWFRVLGGTQNDEQQVFGGVHGDVNASAIVVRVRDLKPVFGPALQFGTMSDFGYLYYFAQASGNKEGVRRTEAQHYYAPDTSFRLQLIERRPLPPVLFAQVASACEAFVKIGSLGLRATRGCGAIAQAEAVPTREAFLKWTSDFSPKVTCRLASEEVFTDWRRCQEALGGWLRNFRKNVVHISGKTDKSALGFSLGKERESSALHLRPVKVQEGYLPLLVYSDEACGQPSLEGRF